MKAVQVIGHGDVDQLRVVDVPIPSPKQGEVLVRVKACGINNTEIWMREGAYGTDKESGWRPEGVQFPRIPGSDITGEVVKVGSGVEETMVGRRVILFPFTSSGEDGEEHIAVDLSFIGSEYDGGYAEYVTWPAALCSDMPLDSFVGDALFATSLEVLKNGGKFCISGSAGGQHTKLDFRTMYLKYITMYGSVLGTRAEFQAMLEAIEVGKVRPIVDRSFPLAEARDAQTYFKQRGKFGKIVLVP